MNVTKKLLSVTACTVVFCAGAVLAQGQGWKGKVGESARDKAVLDATLKQVDQKDCLEFTQKTLRAVTRLALGPEEKSARYIETSLLCVAHAAGDVKYSVIAETIALAPVAYLPALVKEMAPRFNPEANNLTAAQYREVAEKGVKACIDRNRSAGDTMVRNTFAILLFARSNAALQETLLALLDERSRGPVATWLADAARDDYTAILAAAEVDIVPPAPAVNMLGYPQVSRLLGYLNMTDSAFEALMLAGGLGTGYDAEQIQLGNDYQQVPLPRVITPEPPGGYQNQRLRLVNGGRTVWWW